AHCEAHAELKNAAEWARAWHSDDERLQDSDLRIHLHYAHELEQELGGHHAVRIENEAEIVKRAPAFAEIPNVAGLVPCILRAAPIGQGHAAMPCGFQCAELLLFGCGDIGYLAVA